MLLKLGIEEVCTKVLRQPEINNPPILRRIFVCIRFCCVGRIAGYATEATRSKTDKKTSKVGGLFASGCLNTEKGLLLLRFLLSVSLIDFPLKV